MTNFKKPKLDRTIYVMFETCWDDISFSKEKVIALGKDIFFHTGCTDASNIEDYREPLAYDEYGITWFTSLKQIKEKYKIKKVKDDYWEVVI